MMTAAYADESDDKRIFAVSGLIGLLPNWVELERRWRKALKEFGLDEFHAAKCEIPREPFERYSRDQRDHFQRSFYGLIRDAELWGWCSAVWLAEFESRLEALEPLLGLRDPYLFGFRHLVERLASWLDESDFPPTEPVAFVFDRQKEYEGKARALYGALRVTDGLDYGHRLGSLSFDSRFCKVALQAADCWAYEARKFVTETQVEKRAAARWQFEILSASDRLGVSAFSGKQFDDLIAHETRRGRRRVLRAHAKRWLASHPTGRREEPQR